MVTVNGRRQETGAGETVESLLERLGLAARYALVERNGEPVEERLNGLPRPGLLRATVHGDRHRRPAAGLDASAV